MAKFHLVDPPLTAGESTRIRIGPVSVTVNGSAVLLADATLIEFEIKKNQGDADPALVSKSLGDGVTLDGLEHILVDLDPADTSGLGGSYRYDIVGEWSGSRKFIVNPSRVFIDPAVNLVDTP